MFLKWHMTSQKTLIWIIITINLLFECAFLNAMSLFLLFLSKIIGSKKSCDVVELIKNVIAQLKTQCAFVEEK